MGMFDGIFIRCPWCGHDKYEQTKAGPCDLTHYYLLSSNTVKIMAMDGETPAVIYQNLPHFVVESVCNETFTCGVCEKKFAVVDTSKITFEIVKA